MAIREARPITSYTGFLVWIRCGGVVSRTSELVKLPGTVAAGLFSRKGFLEELKGR